MSLPYFPFYPSDFEAKTSHLTLEEDGAYNRLLRLMWMTPGCSLPDDPAWIARRLRVDSATYDRVVAPIISEFFRRARKRIYSPRLSREFERTKVTHELRVSSGKKGGRPAKSLKSDEPDESRAKAGPKQPEPEPEPEERTEAIASDGDAVADVSADPIKAVFDAGIRILTGAGITERQARPFIGKLRKDHPGQDGLILSAIMDCGRAGAVDPIPWITARLAKPKTPSVADIMAKIAAEERPQ